MPKIKLTAQELKRHKEDLKRYQRYLPTLVLKKIQIQVELNRLRGELDERLDQHDRLVEEIGEWIALMGEEAGLSEILKVEAIERDSANVAGIIVPFFKGIVFEKVEYDLYSTPLWVDTAVDKLKGLLSLKAEISTLETQVQALEGELRTTIQRVNLFEKVKIPETLDNIRRIQIFLGDQQTAAVVRGKISKKKVGARSMGQGE
ncbi:MAG: V-type ATP synthase subunit D [Deltaproteobacteria bacterium]|nr:V-type ATP synthase subunit D [Deltaproteobacteria bacterium]MBW2136403.1 V-type ATP synthase subunit D [Deltaproteobacteria bacterium]